MKEVLDIPKSDQLIPSHLLEIKNYEGTGYKPVIDYKTWRVAILNYIDELEPNNIKEMDKHNETDEVFVLLKGEFILFISENLHEPTGKIFAVKLEPFKLYNVKQGIWHSHTLSQDASVLIVENQDTTYENTTRIKLNTKQQEQIIAIARSLLS